MKKLYGLFYLFLLLPVEIAYSQADTVLSYLPLAIGNQWQYRVHEVIPPYIDSTYYSLFTVEGDTIMPNGYQYQVISSSHSSTRYVHIDSTTACVYEYDFDSSRGFMTDSLRCSEGDLFGRDIYCQLIDTATVLNYQTWIMSIDRTIPDFTETHTLAIDIGMTYQYIYTSGGWGTTETSSLVYAKINGYEFGELVTSLNEITNELLKYKLHQNYPNPFNPSTTIKFTILSVGVYRNTLVQLKIYDVLGNEVATLVNEVKPSGEYQIEFSAKGGSASGGDAWNLASGIYFYKLFAGNFVEIKKMILLK